MIVATLNNLDKVKQTNSTTPPTPNTPEPPSPHTVEAYQSLKLGAGNSNSILNLSNRVKKRKKSTWPTFLSTFFPCCSCFLPQQDGLIVQMTEINKSAQPAVITRVITSSLILIRIEPGFFHCDQRKIMAKSVWY